MDIVHLFQQKMREWRKMSFFIEQEFCSGRSGMENFEKNVDKMAISM